MKTKLILNDGSEYEGLSCGAPISSAGEVVFSTGMVGYPEALTDPSYKGQILISTYPLIGNYGVPDKSTWESDHIQVSGLIVSNYIDTPSHFQSKRTLAQWFKDENLPLLEIKDTRALAQKIRETGTMLGRITNPDLIRDYDPNKENLVAQVSTKTIKVLTPSSSPKNKTIVLIDCGAKNNITRCFLKRGVNVIVVPWNTNPFSPPTAHHSPPTHPPFAGRYRNTKLPLVYVFAELDLKKNWKGYQYLANRVSKVAKDFAGKVLPSFAPSYNPFSPPHTATGRLRRQGAPLIRSLTPPPTSHHCPTPGPACSQKNKKRRCLPWQTRPTRSGRFPTTACRIWKASATRASRSRPATGITRPR